MDIVIWSAYLVSSYFLIFWLLVFLEENPNKHSLNRKLKTFPSVSIVIPAYNEERVIGETITKTAALDYPKKRLEIIVVNDGSQDGTRRVVEGLAAKFANTRIKLVNQKNKGKGAALNAGLRLAKGEFFVVLDADSYPRPDALRRLLPHFTSNMVSTVLPLMKLKQATTLLQKIQWCEYLLNFFYKKLMGLVDCIHVSPGPFSIYRKRVLEEMGGFDEHNLTEDLEITLRLQRSNYRIIQTFDTEVYTAAPTTLKAFYQQRNRWYKGSILNMIKHRKMVFNRKYEDFGMLQAPRVLTAGFLAILVISIAVFNFVQPWARRLYDLRYVNYDILTFLRNIAINVHPLDINYDHLYFGLLILGTGLVFLYLAHKHNREKWTARGRITVPAYLFLYSLLVSIVWIGIFFDFVRGKIQKW